MRPDRLLRLPVFGRLCGVRGRGLEISECGHFSDRPTLFQIYINSLSTDMVVQGFFYSNWLFIVRYGGKSLINSKNKIKKFHHFFVDNSLYGEYYSPSLSGIGSKK
jgi:hypothetical protein